MRTFHCSRLFLLAIVLLIVPASLCADVFISVGYAPPLLPVYEQPPCPAEGYIWTPGYWAYGPYGYYWVPGTWVLAPVVGYLWTPGYWGWGGSAFLWHPGYWGPRVGFYGGVNYGYGYNGYGYNGGYWRDRAFYYNRSVNNVNVVNVRNVYNTTVVNNVTVNRVSYNGGKGGLAARPTAAQQAALRERHVSATSLQVQHEQTARQNRSLLATENHGRPPIAATSKPAAFHESGVVAARNAPVNTAAPPAHGNVARPNETNVPRPGNPNATAPHPATAPRPETTARPAPRVASPPREQERENPYRGNAAPHVEKAPAMHASKPEQQPREVPRPPAYEKQAQPASHVKEPPAR